MRGDGNETTGRRGKGDVFFKQNVVYHARKRLIVRGGGMGHLTY